MVDFGSLVNGPREELSYDLEKFYNSLDVKSTHTEPRPAQREAMHEITERHDERDLVLKVSTGAGKTVVGLLYLYAHMKINKAPVAYLCPTLQLVDQVIVEAEKLGIPAKAYPGGTTYPTPECARGDAILVCTYEKLFNAKSTFNRKDVNLMPCAIVLDDAHAGTENIRKQFTLNFDGEPFRLLLEILDPACGSYNKTKWMDIIEGDPQEKIEVPHWIWADAASEIQETLHQFADTGAFKFVWPYLSNMLPLCRCVISGGAAEIAPEILPTYLVRPFDQAQNRLFMSATLADDSLLTRELGTEVFASENPILPPSDRGLGERMIIAPALVDPQLDRNYIMQLCQILSATYNVVVLTSSERQAREWEAFGARYFAGDNFTEGIRLLRTQGSGISYAVFAQRYDGVDLPDDSCRVLVIDGIPQGESLIDNIDAQLSLVPGGIRNRTIFRIEQGMGRPVRSHADYAVILLAGMDLTTFVGRSDVLGAITHDTRNQLTLTIELAELAKKSNPTNLDNAIQQIIYQCLTRDAGWKQYYSNRVREVSKKQPTLNKPHISLAFEERESYRMADNNLTVDAIPRFRNAINESKISNDELGQHLQRLARIAHLVDPVEALKIQQSARANCTAVSIPPAAPRRPSSPGGKTVAEKFCVWFLSFSPANAAVIEAKRIADQLEFKGKPKRVEATIKRLGEALGADSSRPEDEFGIGPDNLWFWGDSCLVIEVKNKNEESLHKSDSGQLHDSLQWAKDNFPEYSDRTQPITVAKVTSVDSDAHYPKNTRVLNQDGARALGTALQQLCQKLASLGPIFLTPQNVLKEMANFNLLPEQFTGKHTVKLK